MGSSSYEKNLQESRSNSNMDILQQSLQAANILEDDNDDIFGELGLTFNNSENVEYPNELEELASQADSLYNSGGSIEPQSSQSNLMDSSSGNEFSTAAQFDTSQFLNTSASVNLDVAPTNSGQQNYALVQGNKSTLNFSQPNVASSQYIYHQQPDVTYSSQQQNTIQQGADSTSFPNFTNSNNLASQTQRGIVVSSSSGRSSMSGSDTYSVTTVSVASAYSVATCHSVFSTQTMSTSTLTSSTDVNQNMLPAGIRIASQDTYQPIINATDGNLQQTNTAQNVLPATVMPSTAIQLVQQPNTDNSQNSRQLISLLQKPNIHSALASSGQSTAQALNGLSVSQSANPLQQNRNVAVLRVAGGKHISIGDPQVMKALTANLVQKQQVEVRTSQQQSPQQFIKLGQNNAFINVSSRPQQQQLVQKAQQITLQNGQTILLNNGQQVQLCAPHSQTGQVQLVQQATAQSIGNNRQVLRNTQQAARNGQIPIKRIQIASVNIPIATSTNSTSANSSTACNTIITLPVQSKHDASRDTVTPTNTNVSNVTHVALPTKNIVQLQNPAAVRNIAVNSNILKQNLISSNSSTTPSNSQQNQSLNNNQVTTVNGQVANNISNIQRAQHGPTLRLNLTPQQASQLTTAQLQTILKQHQATLQARALAANANKTTAETKTAAVEIQQLQNTTPPDQKTTTQNVASADSSLAGILRSSTSNSPVTPIGNSVVVSKPNQQTSQVQIYRIDPTLTDAQADEVKRLLANRTIGSRINTLTREQQQLVFAFRAQIKTMSPPVQQYYLRNPQLFMQKVMQQIRLGKPFILQVKTDVQQVKGNVSVSTVTNNKPLHPTISLTQDPNRTKRVGSPVQAVVAQGRAKSPAIRSASPSLSRTIVTPTVTVQVPRKAVKRSLPEVPQTVSLVLEQLECHKKMATMPDCSTPFRSVRDAIRRLVPFHTCNIPDIKEENFEESEKLFDRIADRIGLRTKAMVNKYHLLCLRDSTRDSCSAEMVMVERMFLQKEKAKLAEDKARLKENPAAIKEYFPGRKFSFEDDEEVITVNSEDDDENSTHNFSSADSSQPTALVELSFEGETGTDSPMYANSTSADSPLSTMNSSSELRTNRYSLESYSSPKSISSCSDSKRRKTDSQDSSSDEVLLQEAVDSILI